jgi:hypothetical protein
LCRPFWALTAWLGDAHNLHAENVFADHGFFGDFTASSTLTSELCVAQRA